jgi:hypothetical protein
MKKILFISLIILYILILPAYPQQNVNVEIKPGVGLGNIVQLFDTFDPDSWGSNYTKTIFVKYCYTYKYPSYGLRIDINDNNSVFFISVESSIYQTKEGIKVGSGMDDVLLFYGNPSTSQKTNDGGYLLYYNGIMFSIGSNKIVKEIGIFN